MGQWLRNLNSRQRRNAKRGRAKRPVRQLLKSARKAGLFTIGDALTK